MNKQGLTAIIPAAGNSKRFKKGNKIFFKIPSLNLSLIEIVILKVIKYTSRIIIVLNKKNFKQCKKLINKKFKNKKFTFLIQNKNKNGTAIAVYDGLKNVKTNLTCVIWGDHIGISTSTIYLAIKKILKKKQLAACVPARIVKKNYTNVIVNKNSLIKEIIGFYDEKKINNNTLNDCGFFVFKTKLMKNILKKNIDNENLKIKRNNEYDFLKIFNFFKKQKVLMTRSTHKYDTLGVNKYKDLKIF
jgi:CTP:molybdopterin cytidylyltransferase MocA